MVKSLSALRRGGREGPGEASEPARSCAAAAGAFGNGNQVIGVQLAFALALDEGGEDRQAVHGVALRSGSAFWWLY
jgi:hypothetical protein